MKIEPQFVNGIQSASASFDGPYGNINSHWEKQADQLSVKVSIPGKLLDEEIKAIQPRLSDGKVSIQIGSGDYLFMIKD